jgi:hypothetical protein
MITGNNPPDDVSLSSDTMSEGSVDTREYIRKGIKDLPKQRVGKFPIGDRCRSRPDIGKPAEKSPPGGALAQN